MSRPKPSEVDWRIELKGRAWDGPSGEGLSRHDMTVGMKLEMRRGLLLWSEEDRLLLAGLLIENLGAEAVVKLGDPVVWKTAVAQLD